ncbi:MAG: alanine racemase, partial [Gammaproteobacteria bacterium]
MTETVVAVIRPEAILHNLQRLREAASGCRFMAVIKANAYGHGFLSVAQLIENEVDALAVARVSEGVRLRDAGIRQRIVVLEGCSQVAEIEEAIAHKLEVVVHDPAHFEMLESVHCESMLDVWVKLDTGMGRLGFPHKSCEDVLKRLQKINCVKPATRLMTHLACADDPDNPMTMEQMRRFGDVLLGFSGDVSIANSAGVLLWPPTLESSPALDYRGENWVRPGLALFGASPVLGKSAREMGLKPAMSFESRLIAVKTIRRGSSVGYGGKWRARRDTVVGIVAA